MSAGKDFSHLDELHMRRALELAELGRYTVTPNPCVGALVVNGGDVVGEGWHAKAGEPHAEIFALRQAGGSAKGATVYVTLEPCSHTGRTGPCVDALIAAGVSKIFFAMRDPNPDVSGQGANRLRAAGIEVCEGLLEDSARDLNAGFNKRMRCGKPLVTMKLAASLDGRSAMASGESQWITGELARANAQALRASSCAILTGSATVIYDDPRYTVRSGVLGQAVIRQPDLWITDSELRVPLESQVVKTLDKNERRLVFLADSSKKSAWENRARLLVDRGAEIIECGPAQEPPGLDPEAIVAAAGDRQVNNLLVEAGSKLSGALLSAGLVDEIIYYVAPVFLGSTAQPVAELSIDVLGRAVKLEIVDRQVLGEDLRIHARVVHPDQ